MKRTGALLVLVLAGTGPAAPDVRLERRADGVKVIRNEPAEARARRFAPRLVAPPTELLVELVERWAAERELDPRLVQAVMQVESGYNVKALSNKGAMGLMQLMPDTARELAVEDPWDPDQNVRGGTAYLRRMLDTFSGDLQRALAAYNAGPGAVTRHAGVPPYDETRDYVRKILCLVDGDCPESDQLEGRKVHIVRDADNRIVLTTSGPPR